VADAFGANLLAREDGERFPPLTRKMPLSQLSCERFTCLRTLSGRAVQTLNVEHAGHAFHGAHDPVEMLHVEDFDRDFDAPVIV